MVREMNTVESNNEATLSIRARHAVKNGEKPENFWSAIDIISGLRESCDKLDLQFNVERLFDSLMNQGLRQRFLRIASKHHVNGDMCDFLSIDDVSVARVFGDYENDVILRSRVKELKDQRTENHSENLYAMAGNTSSSFNGSKKDQIRAEYQKTHGYASNSVAAFMNEHPDECIYGINESQMKTVSVPAGYGKRFICPIKDAERKFISGFDAIDDEYEKWYSEYEISDMARWLSDGINIDETKAKEILRSMRAEYEKAHGYPSNSVAAYRHNHPGRVNEFVENGIRKLSVKLNSNTFVCHANREYEARVKGYDALRNDFRDACREQLESKTK